MKPTLDEREIRAEIEEAIADDARREQDRLDVGPDMARLALAYRIERGRAFQRRLRWLGVGGGS